MFSDNAFVTLTYRDDAQVTLDPAHLRNFLKRLRLVYKNYQEELGFDDDDIRKFRFYGVGEYGDSTERPHYHLALFNFPTCLRLRTERKPETKSRAMWEQCCTVCNLVGRTWGYGDVDLGVLETSSAQYVAGYVTKKMTHRSDPRLKGREPEFSRMSLKPGIGRDAVFEIADTMLRHGLDSSSADVPVSLRHGSRQLPLGRYLRQNLRKAIGRDVKTPQVVLDAQKEEMSPLRDLQFAQKKASLQSTILSVHKGKRARFKARALIYKTRKTL